MGLKIFNSKISSLAKDFDLRMDSKFYGRINFYNFKIIENSSYPLIELRHVIAPKYEEIDFEEYKTYNALSTHSDNFDEDGEIVDYKEVTKEDHPSRIKYIPIENSIVLSSLKGAKVSAILIDKSKMNYVLSNGFYIFINNNQTFRTEYIYYLLRSKLFKKILDENLSRGISISSYYERDLLRIKIPLVPKDIQDETIKRIKKVEIEIKNIKQSMPDTQEVIEEVLEKYLDCFYNRELIDQKKTKIFHKRVSDIGKRKNLRLDPKYYLFWDKTEGKIFSSNKVNNIKLVKVIKLVKEKIIQKGDLEKEYILIDKEDVDSKRGIIVNENVVTKIDSDKILFGDADILIPKLRPYLGGTFINIKNKNFIGTPEFLPYLVNEKILLKEYLKYILLSKDFLSLVPYLSSGKEHPRLSSYDLESIEIPLPQDDINLSKQMRIVKLIEIKLGDLNEKRKTIENNREKIEKLIITSLK